MAPFAGDYRMLIHWASDNTFVIARMGLRAQGCVRMQWAGASDAGA